MTISRSRSIRRGPHPHPESGRAVGNAARSEAPPPAREQGSWMTATPNVRPVPHDEAGADLGVGLDLGRVGDGKRAAAHDRRAESAIVISVCRSIAPRFPTLLESDLGHECVHRRAGSAHRRERRASRHALPRRDITRCSPPRRSGRCAVGAHVRRLGDGSRRSTSVRIAATNANLAKRSSRQAARSISIG